MRYRGGKGEGLERQKAILLRFFSIYTACIELWVFVSELYNDKEAWGKIARPVDLCCRAYGSSVFNYLFH